METNYKDGPVSHKNHILTTSGTIPYIQITLDIDTSIYIALLTQIGGGKILNSTKYI